MSIAGISLPLQIKRIISGTLISAISQLPIAALNHRISFQREMQENYQPWIWMGFPLSVISTGHPIELDKPHILALAAETGFLLFKEQVPL